MKRSFLLWLMAASLFVSPLVALADNDAPDQTVAFSDGSQATSYNHCGDSDICALVKYPNGDRLAIYSEGAAYCQPYVLHFVKTNGPATIYEYSRTINHDAPSNSGFGVHCGNSRDTQMVMDHGLIHMTVTENHDGTLSIAFTPTKDGMMRRQSGGDDATPTPNATP